MFHFQLEMGREELGLRASRMDIQIILFCSEVFAKLSMSFFGYF